MNQYVIVLFTIFTIFLTLCIIIAFGAYIYYHRKSEFEHQARNLREYRYFVQPFFDSATTIISYELLLREYNAQTNTWGEPYDVKHFPLDRLVIAIKDVQVLIPRYINSISIDMTVSQCLDHQVELFIKWMLGILYKQKLNIEVDADELINLNKVDQIRFRMFLHKIYQQGILITIKNIKSEDKYYEDLIQYNDYVAHYSLSAKEFDLKRNDLIEKWQSISNDQDKKLILTDIDTIEVDRIAEQYNFSIRQGSYYSELKPVRSME